MKPTLEALGMVCALGMDHETIAGRLFRGDTGRMVPRTLRTTGAEVYVGAVHESLPPLPEDLSFYECRNHRLAAAAFAQIEAHVAALVARYGAGRVAVVLGSSTAGLDATEEAYGLWQKEGRLPARYNYKRQHAMGSVSSVVADLGGLKGPAYTLSTACTSAAKAMISARDLLATGYCDAVVTGGVDTLCHLTLNGFEALGALSRQVCLPMSDHRSGLNIGEGAAFFVMTREPGPITLAGVGESTDAHHMSAPHPEGEGAEACMRAALADARLEPRQISYVNLHGTATRQNDAMEAKALARVFTRVPAASTKPMVGHCLGAAGSMEAGFCWLAMGRRDQRGYPLPPHVWDGRADPELPELDLAAAGRRVQPKGTAYFMSCSYAFGGNNCAVILAHEGGAS